MTAKDKDTIEDLKRPFIGCWRIIDSPDFDSSYINMNGKAHLIVPSDNDFGELSVGLLVASLDFSYAPNTIFFDWSGHDEMDESIGQGSLELTGKDKADLELEYCNGDVAEFTAIRVSG